MSELIKGPFSKKQIEEMYDIKKGSWRQRSKEIGLMRKMVFSEPSKSMKKKSVYFVVAKNLNIQY